MDPGRHSVRRLPHAPHSVSVRGVEGGGTSGQRPHRFEDGPDARPFQRQLCESLVDVVRQLDLRQLSLHPPLQLRALEDACDLAGDRPQEIDVAGNELTALGGLGVEHADKPGARLDRHRQHRVEAILVKAWHPFPMGLLADVRDDGRLARLGHPACDAFADAHLHLSHHVFVEAVGRGQQQLATRWQQQIERADISAHGRGGLADDQGQQLVRFLGRGSRLRQPDQEAELPGCQVAVGSPPGRRHVVSIAQRATPCLV